MYIILDTHLSCTQYLYHTGQKTVSRIMNLTFPPSILDLRHQNQSDQYQHHVESNNISITVSFTTILKRKREIAKSLYISFLQGNSSNKNQVQSVVGLNMNIPSCHHPFYYNQNFTVHFMDVCFTLLFFPSYSNLRIQKTIQMQF